MDVLLNRRWLYLYSLLIAMLPGSIHFSLGLPIPAGPGVRQHGRGEEEAGLDAEEASGLGVYCDDNDSIKTVCNSKDSASGSGWTRIQRNGTV